MSDDRNLPDLRRIRGWTKTWRSPQGTEISVELPFDEVRVQHFRNLDANEVFKVWMGGEPEIRRIVDQLEQHYRRLTGDPPTTDRNYANFLKRFASSFRYEFDDLSIGYSDYGKFPIELLYDGEGDCECLSYLLASLLAHAGFEVSILHVLVKNGKIDGHVAVGLALPRNEGDDVIQWSGVPYLYCEAVTGQPVGRCGFDFSFVREHASANPIPRDYRWGGSPPPWPCPRGCGDVRPWIERCARCGSTAVLSERQRSGDLATDWDRILRRFLGWVEWIRGASEAELAREIRALRNSDMWSEVPVGNARYLDATLARLDRRETGDVTKHLEGCRQHLLSAWPHIVAAVFCRQPESTRTGDPLYRSVKGLGESVYAMSNPTLAAFAHKILLDTTCKRVAGFSGGSRLAIGRILEKYDGEGEGYLSSKRQSIENILVKVVIPQVFALLAREAESGGDTPSVSGLSS